MATVAIDEAAMFGDRRLELVGTPTADAFHRTYGDFLNPHGRASLELRRSGNEVHLSMVRQEMYTLVARYRFPGAGRPVELVENLLPDGLSVEILNFNGLKGRRARDDGVISDNDE
jgi:hypothetical protein